MVGDRLKELRESLRMNKRQFADSLNVKYTTYNGYETESREPGSDFLLLVAKTYNVTVDYLVGLTDNPNETYKKNIPAPAEAETGDAYLVELFYQLLVESGFLREGDQFTLRQAEAVAGMIRITKAVFMEDERRLIG